MGGQSGEKLLAQPNPAMPTQSNPAPALRPGCNLQPDSCEPGGFFPQVVPQTTGCGLASIGHGYAGAPMLGSSFVSGTRLPPRGGFAGIQGGIAGIQGGLSV